MHELWLLREKQSNTLIMTCHLTDHRFATPLQRNARITEGNVAMWLLEAPLIWLTLSEDGALRNKSCLEVSLCSYRESQWSLLPAWVIYLRPVFPEPTWCQGTGTGMRSALHGTSGAERWAQRAAKTKRTKPTTRVSLVHSWPLRGQKKSIRNCT